MKPLHFAAIVPLALVLSGIKAQDSPHDVAVPADQLSVLQREKDRRTAAALKSIEEWYTDQLAMLKEPLSVASPKTNEPPANLPAKERSRYWTDNQPELKAALVSNGWLWRSEDDATGVHVTFHDNGTATHIGMQDVWSITGPSEVTINTTEQERFVLRFNSSLTCYEADCRGVEGQRLSPEK